MIKKLLKLSIIFAFSIVSTFVYADGNITAGKTKAINCVSCHGENGNSLLPAFPKLAGQHAGYLVRQLQDLKDGFRKAPMMAPIAMELDDQSIEDIAVYYASQKISANPLPILEYDEDEDEPTYETDDKSAQLHELLTLGRKLYRNGNMKTKVSSCIACHGPLAEGNIPALIPSLRSQHADYLIKSLTDFKKGVRNTRSDNMMHMIARKMTDKEIQAVSYHISMLK